jgi:NAD+ kinase
MTAPRLGIVLHRHRPEVLELAKRALDWCGSEVAAVLPESDGELVGRADLAVPEEQFGPGLSACLSLGGDGTMLRATALVASHDVPILGVNAGHLGYLTAFDPATMEQALDQWLAGALRTERRMMLDVWTNGGEVWVGRALNEAVIDRSESGRTVELSVAIGGRPFITYLADGLIVATPTGSTAYALSAGGPIVEPNFRTLLLTPVAAHNVFNRTMVLAPDTEVELTVAGFRPAVVSLDGRHSLALEPGQSVLCRSSTVEVTFLVTGNRDFHSVLKDKFGVVNR